MADRTITARLRVAYENSGLKKMSTDLRGVASEGKKTSQAVGRDWSELGRKTAAIGSSMTTKVTLPFVGLSAVASKASSDFDAAFVRMTTLAGVSGDAVSGLKDQVLSLAEETGRGPQELALAFEKLASSGLSTEDAMDALTVSAKASAIGLGDTATIADAVSSAMLAYAQSGLEAAEATDILIATARAGKAEPTELANQMGKLLPIASELGISFDDVGAAIAALSQKGNQADAASTQLANLMGKLLKPSQQAEEALHNVGLSVEDVRASLVEKGLLPTLEMLKSKLGDSGFVKFAEDQEAVRAALALTGGDMEKTRQIFADLDDAAGATEEAFGTWAESMGSTQAKAWARMQVALITFGDRAAPVITDILEMLGSLVDVYTDLPGPLQDAVFWLGAFVAALGPVLQVGGRLAQVVTQVQAVTTAFGGVRGTAAALGSASGPLAVLVGSVVALDKAFDALFPVERADLGALENDLVRFNQSGRLAGEAADLLGGDFGKLREATKEIFAPSTLDQLGHIGEGIITLGGNIRDEDRTLTEAKNLFEDLDQALTQLAGRSPEAAAALFAAISGEMQGAGASAQDAKDIFDGYNATLTESDTAARVAADGTGEMGSTATEVAAQVDQLKSALDELLGKYLSVDESVRRQNELVLGLGQHFDDMREKYKGNALALDDNTAAGIANKDMLDELFEASAATTQAMIDQGASSEDVRTQWRQDRGELQLVMEKFRAAGQDVSDYDALIGEINEFVATQISQPGMTTAQGKAINYRELMNRIPERKNTRMSTSGMDAAAATVGSMIRLINSVPSHKNVHLNLSLGGLSGNAIGNLISLTGRRAQGGPVSAGRLYEVAEQGRAELLNMGSHTYLIPGSDGTVTPSLSGHMTPGSAYAEGGMVLNVHVDMRGAVVSNSRQFKRMVSEAFTEEARKGRALASTVKALAG